MTVIIMNSGVVINPYQIAGNIFLKYVSDIILISRDRVKNI